MCTPPAANGIIENGFFKNEDQKKSLKKFYVRKNKFFQFYVRTLDFSFTFGKGPPQSSGLSASDKLEIGCFVQKRTLRFTVELVPRKEVPNIKHIVE